MARRKKYLVTFVSTNPMADLLRAIDGLAITNLSVEEIEKPQKEIE